MRGDVIDGQRRERLWSAIAAHSTAPGEPAWARAVCAACVSAIDVDAAALTLRARSGAAQELLGASDEWAAEREQVQYALGEGPAVAAFTEGEAVVVGDLLAEPQRWPTFAEAAQGMHAAAAFCFPLRIGAIRLGTQRRRRRGLRPVGRTLTARQHQGARPRPPHRRRHDQPTAWLTTLTACRVGWLPAS